MAKIAIITGQRPHHKQLVAALAARHEVVAVFHPPEPARGMRHRGSALRRVTGERGLTQAGLRVLGATKTPLTGWDAKGEVAQAERVFFASAEDAYARLDSEVVHRDADVNGPDVVALLGRLYPDAVVCLGGPIYQQQLITASPLMLNFHSGISPLYNGAATIDFAFANGHPHLCGGTLMLMSTVVDGGDILAHFLPAIEAEDTPATLQMKTVSGAIELVDRFLSDLQLGHRFARCKQPEPLFYFRGRDWTLCQSQNVRRHIDAGTAALHVRESRAAEYWRLDGDNEAQASLISTICGLLDLT